MAIEPHPPDDDVVGFLVSGAGNLPAAEAGDCPDANGLSSVSDAGLDAPEQDALVGHVAGCENCRALLAALVEEPDRRGAEELDGTLMAGESELDRTIDQNRTTATPAPSKRDPDLPERFGDYAIVRHIGAGGMGVVYEALHDVRQRPEALKVVKKGLGHDPHFVERFHREVRSMAGLTHDHVVPVFDSGESDGDLYYTMPLLPGPALDFVIAEVHGTGESPPAAKANAVLDRHGFQDAGGEGDAESVRYAKRVAAAIAPVADALHVMHTSKMLHRDIKPGNLILGPNGRVLLADFGLVRTEDRTITNTGQMLGTPAYMSPEQVLPEGETVDGRSDVYSLGASLYELLTGQIPHRGESVAETLAMILRLRVTPVRELNPGVPREIETVVGRCLEKRVEDRYESAAALRDDLQAFSRGETVATQPVSRLTRARHWVADHLVPVLLVAALLLGLAGWYGTRPAYLSVRALPHANVLLNGKDLGTTPKEDLEIAPGDHVLELRLDRFATFQRRFTVDRLGHLDIERSLQALDPTDPQALSAIAAAHGLQITAFEYRADRGSGDEPALSPHFPRGRLLDPPTKISLWVADIAEGYRARLLAPDGTEVLAWDVEAPEIGLYASRKLADFKHTWARGGAYTISVEKENEDPQTCTFTIVEAAERNRVGGMLADLAKSFNEDDPVVNVLRFEILMAEHLHTDAFDLALDQQETLGQGRQLARMALLAIEKSGLEGRGLWLALSDLFLDEGDGGD